VQLKTNAPGEDGKAGEAIKRIQALVDVGFQYFVCTISGNDVVETLNLLARQVIPNIVA
jgi:hypothetical protein